jgi:hypothetical protein
MKTNAFHRIGLAAALACALTGISSATDNLVLNPSFENTTGITVGGLEGSTGLSWLQPTTGVDNWTAIRTDNFYLRPPTPVAEDGDYCRTPQDGTSYVILHANTGEIGGIYQQLTLTAGITYTVSFWELNRGQAGITGIDAGFFSDAALSTAVSSVHTANNLAADGWKQTTFTYTPAESGSLYLGFKVNSGAPWGSCLDNVSVTSGAVLTATTTTLESLSNPSVHGDSVTFRATIKDAGATATGAAGTVAFKIDGTVLKADATISNGVASYSTSTPLAAGDHPVVAIYSGDGTYQASTSSTLTQTVTGIPAGDNLVLNPSFETTNGVFPIGNYDPGCGLGPLPTDGLANWAVIRSDNFYIRQPSPPTDNGDYGRIPVDGSSYVILHANTGEIGGIYQQLTLTAGVEYTVSFWEVNRSSQGAVTGVDAGFFSDTALSTPVSSIATANNPAAGGWKQTSFTYTPAATGPVYLGFKANSGAPWGSNLDNVSVTAPAGPVLTATTTTMESSPATNSALGDSVTFTATVKDGEVNVPSGAGTVEFKSDIDGVLPDAAAIAIVNGVATYSTSALSVADHTITATYSGDSTYQTSASSGLSHSVTTTPFGTWAYTNIKLKQPTADASPTGDPDGDGSNNLTEYAFFGDPLSGSDNSKVFCQVEESKSAPRGKELILTVAVRDDAPNFGLDGNGLTRSATSTSGAITYAIQGSDNLVFPGIEVTEVGDHSTAAMKAPLPAGTGYGYRSFVLLDGGLAGKGFLRAVVVK